MKAIYEYPYKTFIVADIVRLIGGTKTEVKIVHVIDRKYDDVLFAGKMKDLEDDDNELAPYLLSLPVDHILIGRTGKVRIFI